MRLAHLLNTLILHQLALGRGLTECGRWVAERRITEPERFFSGWRRRRSLNLALVIRIISRMQYNQLSEWIMT